MAVTTLVNGCIVNVLFNAVTSISRHWHKTAPNLNSQIYSSIQHAADFYDYMQA